MANKFDLLGIAHLQIVSQRESLDCIYWILCCRLSIWNSEANGFGWLWILVDFCIKKVLSVSTTNFTVKPLNLQVANRCIMWPRLSSLNLKSAQLCARPLSPSELFMFLGVKLRPAFIPKSFIPESVPSTRTWLFQDRGRSDSKADSPPESNDCQANSK